MSTPLHRASSNSHEAIVQLRLERGASVNARSIVDQTPQEIPVAEENGHVAIVRLLSARAREIEREPEPQPGKYAT